MLLVERDRDRGGQVGEMDTTSVQELRAIVADTVQHPRKLRESNSAFTATLKEVKLHARGNEHRMRKGLGKNFSFSHFGASLYCRARVVQEDAAARFCFDSLFSALSVWVLMNGFD